MEVVLQERAAGYRLQAVRPGGRIKEVAAEGTGASNRLSYTLAPGPIGGIISRSDPSGGTFYYHYDRLGNVVAVTDGNGNLVDIYSMDAFGNVLQVAQSGYGYYENANSSQPYHLTTKELDSDAGLYYFNARWYDPATGRFVSCDPLAPLRGNQYFYASADPVGRVDPTGELSFRDICNWIGNILGIPKPGTPPPNRPPTRPTRPFPSPDPKKPWQGVCSKGGTWAADNGCGNPDDCDACCIEQKYPPTVLKYPLPNLSGEDLRDCKRYCYLSTGSIYDDNYYPDASAE